jgi:hypothetical protein
MVRNMKLPERKPNRICEYDYSTNGAYFVTVCTHDRKKILWDGVGADILRPVFSCPFPALSIFWT